MTSRAEIPCPLCRKARGQRKLVTFTKKARAHCYCTRCKCSYDSDALALQGLASLEGLPYRTAYVETPTIARDGAIYADFKWTDEAALREAVVAPVIEAFRPLSPRRILDLGCGNGFTTAILAREFGTVIGLDPSPQNPGVQGTLETVKFPDGYFDAVAIVGNLMLHRDIPATMREVARILLPGGIVYLDFKNIRASSRVCARWLSRVSNAPAVRRNFANMRYGLHRGHIPMIAEGFKVERVRTAAPRLLAHDNASDWQKGVAGLAWRTLDRIDRIRDEQAWVQVTMRKLAA